VLVDAALASHASRVRCATESPFGATPLLIIPTKFRPTAPCGVGSDVGVPVKPHPEETPLALGGSRVERGCAADRQRSLDVASRRPMRK
jgi:hypothetical protein